MTNHPIPHQADRRAPSRVAHAEMRASPQIVEARPIEFRALPLNRPATRLQRLAAWRRAHYVGDQLIRVGLLAGGALIGLATFCLVVGAVVSALIGTIPVSLGVLVCVVVGAALALASRRLPSKTVGSAAGCSGLHCAGCQHH